MVCFWGMNWHLTSRPLLAGRYTWRYNSRKRVVTTGTLGHAVLEDGFISRWMTSAAAKERVEECLRREPTWVHRYVSVCHCEISCSKGLFITRVKGVYTPSNRRRIKRLRDEGGCRERGEREEICSSYAGFAQDGKYTRARVAVSFGSSTCKHDCSFGW